VSPPGRGALPLAAFSNADALQPFAITWGAFASLGEAVDDYRLWALQQKWASGGPIGQRAGLAPWFPQLPLWLNTGWQQKDIFNETQGDPQVVLARMSTLLDKLALPAGLEVALHWYVWDEIAFDTHYPDYFPAKPGFAEAVTELQRLGVRVFPYINGRILDQVSGEWLAGSAQQWACKAAAPSLGASHLSFYNETYGSGSYFVVMCPATRYWQETIAGAANTLVSNYSVDGVYIDQIAAAQADQCWDPTHNHALGGGGYWIEGYAQMVAAAKATGAPIVTESNAEPYMDSVDGLLALVAFGVPLGGSGAETAGSLPVHFSPLFPSVYGGLYVAFGAEFFQSDLAPNPDVFTSKLALQLVAGAQLGWMSLGGTQTPPPMGLYDMLVDPAHAAELAFLSEASQFRLKMRPFLQDGRLVPQACGVNGTTAAWQVIAAAWLLPPSDSPELAAIVFANPTRSDAPDAFFTVVPPLLGLGDGDSIEVTLQTLDCSQVLYSGPSRSWFSFPVATPARSVGALLISLQP
jgi:hypothetical protein